MIFAAGALAAMSLAGAAAMALGQRVYHLSAVAIGRIALMAVSFFLLQMAWFAVALFLSALGRTAGRVFFAGFLFALLSYLAQVVGQLWPKAAFLLRYSLNGYHDPRAIAKSGVLPAASAAVFVVLTAGFIGLALWRFKRRDIP